MLELPPPVFVDPAEYLDHTNFRTVECTCGRESGYLSTNGDLFPCSYTVGDRSSEEFKIGNITDEDFSFKEAWTSGGAIEKYKKRNGITTCPSQVALLRNVACSH
jgi:radical SAM protein with 4Fe4S-binding SPASM domain